ncbi:tetratricopeptide repeat protein, partial [bacterium]|nr:tetratricopeptide repeat protein [bacterium]
MTTQSDDLLSEVALSIQKGDFKNAIAMLDRMLLESPDANVLHAKGTILGMMRQPEDAILAYQKALELDPANLMIMVDLAQQKYDMDLIDDAKALLKEVLQIDAKNGDAHLLIGIIKFDAGHFESALPHFEAAAKVLSKESTPLVFKARSLAELDRNDEAVEAFNQATERNPNDVEAYFFMAEFLLELQRVLDAIPYLEKTIEIDPLNDIASHRLGVIYLELQQYEAAAKVYEIRLQINPKNPDDQYRYGMALFNLKQYDDAIETFNTLLADDPNDIPALCSKGMAQFYQGASDTALATLADAQKKGPEHYMPRLHEGLVYFEQKNYANAIKCFEKAVE